MLTDHVPVAGDKSTTPDGTAARDSRLTYHSLHHIARDVIEAMTALRIGDAIEVHRLDQSGRLAWLLPSELDVLRVEGSLEELSRLAERVNLYQRNRAVLDRDRRHVQAPARGHRNGKGCTCTSCVASEA